MIRIAGVLIVSAWDVRKAALRIFPYSARNARRWVHNYRFCPSAPRVEIGCAANSPEKFERQSGMDPPPNSRLSSMSGRTFR